MNYIIWVFPSMVVPPKHPKMIIFSRKAPWLLGYHHFRKPPYIPKSIKFQPLPGGLWSDGFAGADPPVVVMSWKITAQKFNILLMEEILHQLIGSLSHYIQGFIHPRWCKISSTNSRYHKWPFLKEIHVPNHRRTNLGSIPHSSPTASG